MSVDTFEIDMTDALLLFFVNKRFRRKETFAVTQGNINMMYF